MQIHALFWFLVDRGKSHFCFQWCVKAQGVKVKFRITMATILLYIFEPLMQSNPTSDSEHYSAPEPHAPIIPADDETTSSTSTTVVPGLHFQ